MQKKKENSRATKEDRLFNWLENINGLKTNSGQAAKEQKERKGSLKTDIEKSQNNRGDKKLKTLCKKAGELHLKMIEGLCEPLEQENRKKELERNPATSVFLLAQIHSLVFKDRNGNSSTCPVCSLDNAFRMTPPSDSKKRG